MKQQSLVLLASFTFHVSTFLAFLPSRSLFFSEIEYFFFFFFFFCLNSSFSLPTVGQSSSSFVGNLIYCCPSLHRLAWPGLACSALPGRRMSLTLLLLLLLMPCSDANDALPHSTLGLVGLYYRGITIRLPGPCSLLFFSPFSPPS